MAGQKRCGRAFINSAGFLFVSPIKNRQGLNAFQGRKLCKAQYKTVIIKYTRTRTKNAHAREN